MKNIKRKRLFLFSTSLAVGSIVALGYTFIFSANPSDNDSEKNLILPSTQTVAAALTQHTPKPKYVRGLHLTSWVAGDRKLRQPLDRLLERSEINTLVIDIKEYEGEIYLPGYKKAEDYKCVTNAIPDLDRYLAELKKKKAYLIARIVVFKDSSLTKKRPDLAVQNVNGGLWKDRAGLTWLDPYNKENWDYNIGLAEHAVKMGFDEIQFDYIRFPSDGNIRNCRYVVRHSSTTAAAAIVNFLEEANKRLKPLGAYISIDVFGLTTTVTGDMGIGQKIVEMSQWVDFVSPMVYPSHYNPGEYGIPEPNKAPYHTVYLSLESAKRRIPSSKLRPYLQDFSLGYHYGEKELKEQIQACYDNDIGEWLLWNPRCVYTEKALKTKEFASSYKKMPLPSYIKERKPPRTMEVSTCAVPAVAVSSDTVAAGVSVSSDAVCVLQTSITTPVEILFEGPAPSTAPVTAPAVIQTDQQK